MKQQWATQRVNYRVHSTATFKRDVESRIKESDPFPKGSVADRTASEKRERLAERDGKILRRMSRRVVEKDGGTRLQTDRLQLNHDCFESENCYDIEIENADEKQVNLYEIWRNGRLFGGGQFS